MRVAQLVDLVEDGTKGGQAHSVQVGEEEVEAPVTTLIQLEGLVEASAILHRDEVQVAWDSFVVVDWV